MSKCSIKVNGGNVKVDKYQPLMDSILEYTSYNIDKAVDLYGIALSEDYEKLVIDKNNLDSFLRYIKVQNINNINKLTAKENQYLNTILNQPNTDIDFREKFVETFSNNGVYELNLHKIEDSGLKIIDPIANSKTLEKIYYYIQSNQADFEVFNQPIFSGVSDNLDKNTYVTKLNYADILTKEGIIEKAIELEDIIVLNDESLQDWLLNFNKSKSFIPKLYIGTNGSLQPVTNSFSNRLSISLDVSQDFTVIQESIGYFLENLNDISTNNDISTIENYADKLEKVLLSKGIPVKGLSDKILDSPLEDTENFLGSLYNFLEDVTSVNNSISDSLYELNLEYNNLFDVTNDKTLVEVDRVDNIEDYVHVKTKVSPSEMLKNFGLIKAGDNLYKLYSVSLEGVSNLYDESKMGNIFREYFRAGDNVDDVKAFSVAFYTQDLNIKNSQIDSRYNRDINLDMDNFTEKFNKKLLKNELLDSLFYFTENGIESSSEINEYTKNVLKTILSEKDYKELEDYALISGNESLKGLLPNFNLISEKNNENYRNFILNNPNNLLSLKSEYEKHGDVIVAKNIHGDFIKVDGFIYERVKGDNFVKHEFPLENIFNAKKPKLEKEYDTFETTSEKVVKIENNKLTKELC